MGPVNKMGEETRHLTYEMTEEFIGWLDDIRKDFCY